MVSLGLWSIILASKPELLNGYNGLRNNQMIKMVTYGYNG